MRILIILIALLIIGCSSSNGFKGSNEVGYWVDGRSSNQSIWQCVEPFAPHRNKKC